MFDLSFNLSPRVIARRKMKKINKVIKNIIYTLLGTQLKPPPPEEGCFSSV